MVGTAAIPALALRIAAWSSRRHRYGSSTRVPGVDAPTRASSVSSMMTRCWSTLPGSPMGRPKGKRTWTTLGGLTRSSISLNIITMTVGIPAASIALATSPTDRLQTGQVQGYGMVISVGILAILAAYLIWG